MSYFSLNKAASLRELRVSDVFGPAVELVSKSRYRARTLRRASVPRSRAQSGLWEQPGGVAAAFRRGRGSPVTARGAAGARPGLGRGSVRSARSRQALPALPARPRALSAGSVLPWARQRGPSPPRTVMWPQEGLAGLRLLALPGGL